MNGTWGRNRTDTPVKELDFESSASTNFATQARCSSAEAHSKAGQDKVPGQTSLRSKVKSDLALCPDPEMKSTMLFSIGR